MKFLILIFCSLIITAATKAQVHTQNSLQLYKNNFNQKQYKRIFSHAYDTSIIPHNYDNSVLKIFEPVLTYKGNSKEFDIYQATPDNMYIIKPDSTIAFNMPVKKFMMHIEPVK